MSLSVSFTLKPDAPDLVKSHDRFFKACNPDTQVSEAWYQSYLDAASHGGEGYAGPNTQALQEFKEQRRQLAAAYEQNINTMAAALKKEGVSDDEVRGLMFGEGLGRAQEGVPSGYFKALLSRTAAEIVRNPEELRGTAAYAKRIFEIPAVYSKETIAEKLAARPELAGETDEQRQALANDLAEESQAEHEQAGCRVDFYHSMIAQHEAAMANVPEEKRLGMLAGNAYRWQRTQLHHPHKANTEQDSQAAG